MNEQDRTNKVLVGFLCGAAVGAGIALLTAPASGEETRKRIGETARKVAGTTRDRFNRIRGRIDELGHDLHDSVAHGVEEMRDHSR
ncbi:MAG TPA: YtxH domain-containing protein [Candidatus Eisenbacteria bacterium]|nr:YtxH domain-containing protein [Candidatus Eisenbacteria bacterium]